MAASDESSVAYVFKRKYSDRRSTDSSMREHPTLNLISKEEGLEGVGLFYAITYGNPQGISSGSAGLATAQTNFSGMKGEQLALSRALKYGTIKLAGPALRAARGDQGSFYDFVTRHTDGILDEMGADIAFNLFTDQNGIRGRRSSVSGNTVTLTEKRHVDRFRVGMTVGASSSSDGSSPRTGTTTVAKILRGSTAIVLTDASSILSFTDGDYLFRQGDPGNCMQGMDVCTPLAAISSSDSFRGINRSVDQELLAGTRLDDTNKLPEEALGDLAVEIFALGKRVKRGVVYPTVFQSIVKRQGAKVMYDAGGGEVDIGFEYIMLHTAGGTIKLYSDPDCPVDRGRVFNPETHCIRTLDPLVHVIRDDGKTAQRSTTEDAIEVRVRSMHNYLQYDPAPHGVCSFAA
jgi:hypothetical protein